MSETSLSQFVQQKREKLGLSATELAKKCHMKLSLIEEIEAGKELFLSTTIRQNLAKGLRCSADEIKVLEKSFENKFVEENIIYELKQRILKGEKDLICPKCNSLLITRIAKMYDLEDNLMLHPKARCTKCVFQIKD